MMTALNFSLLEDAIWVTTDTLATTMDDRPAFFTTKVFPLPHWNGLICGRGSPALILNWLCHAMDGIPALDLIRLDEFAPDILKQLFHERSLEEQQNCPTSIYHLGLDHDDNIFRGFAYRSVNDFVSEPLPYGLHTKPGYDGSSADPQDDLITMMCRQRSEQDKLPLEERCHIGGEIIVWMMERVVRENARPTVSTTILPVYQWADFYEMYAECAMQFDEQRIFGSIF